MKHMLENLLHKSRNGRRKWKYSPMIWYVVCVIIIAFAITGVSLSKYIVASSSQVVARVATFNVAVTHADWSDGYDKDVQTFIDLDSENPSKTYTFTVTNNGEMTIIARLVVDSVESPTENVVLDLNESSPDWILLNAGEEKNIDITVPGSGMGTDVKVHLEYEQIH